MSGNVGSTRLSGLDRMGMMISGICLIHCLALPLIAALLPFFAVTLPGDEWTHRVLLGMALPVTGFALLRGWRRHRAAGPAITGAVGLGLIATALFVPEETMEVALTVVGGLIVIRAHIGNWRAHRR
ncbi:MAG TPA: MerC domain-containing protein [Croceibacterium sp.]|nr:MerC domain-containing protein [Croceibacterium sp.]